MSLHESYRKCNKDNTTSISLAIILTAYPTFNLHPILLGYEADSTALSRLFLKDVTIRVLAISFPDIGCRPQYHSCKVLLSSQQPHQQVHSLQSLEIFSSSISRNLQFIFCGTYQQKTNLYDLIYGDLVFFKESAALSSKNGTSTLA